MVQYSLADHLSTTSLVLDALGDKVAESRHFPYGGGRWRWPEDSTFPTDYRFTGQRFDGYIKLYLMGARWYDSALGRWISPDSIVPDPMGPQALNRYSFVVGNPLRYIDPSGHGICDEPGGGEDNPDCRAREEDDPLYELYTILGLEDVMDFSTFRSGIEVLAESYQAFKEAGVFDEWVPAGIRFEGTGAILVGLDLNVDIVWDWNSFDGDVVITLGWQVGLNAGVSGNGGPLFTEGVYSLDDYMQINDHAGLTLSDDVFLNVAGLEGDYGWSDCQPDGRRIQSFYLCLLGGGEELGVWRGGTIKAWSVIDVLSHIFSW
jgi:RHS repeat-associated protein